MNLSLLPGRLTICQLPSHAPLPSWTVGPAEFLSITRTAEELSIVCTEELVPPSALQVCGWRAFKVAGPLDFALTGILAALATPLAAAGISIFSVATYNTDYVLVKADQVNAAAQAWRAAGHSVALD